MTYDASNRKDIRRAEKAARQAELDQANFLIAAMSTREGRAWFYTQMEECHIFSDPFIGDPYREAHNKGERNVGLRYFAAISRYCPDSYILMIKEANDRRITADTAASRDHDPASAGERPSGENSGRDVEGSEPNLDDNLGGYPN